MPTASRLSISGPCSLFVCRNKLLLSLWKLLLSLWRSFKMLLEIHAIPCLLEQLISSFDSIIEDGLYPVHTADSTGGVYFCYNRYEVICKPYTEELYNEKNLSSVLLSSVMDRGHYSQMGRSSRSCYLLHRQGLLC